MALHCLDVRFHHHENRSQMKLNPIQIFYSYSIIQIGSKYTCHVERTNFYEDMKASLITVWCNNPQHLRTGVTAADVNEQVQRRMYFWLPPHAKCPKELPVTYSRERQGSQRGKKLLILGKIVIVIIIIIIISVRFMFLIRHEPHISLPWFKDLGDGLSCCNISHHNTSAILYFHPGATLTQNLWSPSSVQLGWRCGQYNSGPS